MNLTLVPSLLYQLSNIISKFYVDFILFHAAAAHGGGTGVNPCSPAALQAGRYYHAVQSDPSAFVQCDESGSAHLKRCPAPLAWNVELNTCASRSWSSSSDVVVATGPAASTSTQQRQQVPPIRSADVPVVQQAPAILVRGVPNQIRWPQQTGTAPSSGGYDGIENGRSTKDGGGGGGDGGGVWKQGVTNPCSYPSVRYIPRYNTPSGYYECIEGRLVERACAGSDEIWIQNRAECVNVGASGGGTGTSNVGGGASSTTWTGTSSGSAASATSGGGRSGGGGVIGIENPCLADAADRQLHPFSGDATKYVECYREHRLIVIRRCAAGQVWTQGLGTCGAAAGQQQQESGGAFQQSASGGVGNGVAVRQWQQRQQHQWQQWKQWQQQQQQQQQLQQQQVAGGGGDVAAGSGTVVQQQQQQPTFVYPSDYHQPVQLVNGPSFIFPANHGEPNGGGSGAGGGGPIAQAAPGATQQVYGATSSGASHSGSGLQWWDSTGGVPNQGGGSSSFSSSSGRLYTVSGDENPCGSDGGETMYFPFTADPAYYVQCDAFGGAFVRPCPAGLLWDAVEVTCSWPVGGRGLDQADQDAAAGGASASWQLQAQQQQQQQQPAAQLPTGRGSGNVITWRSIYYPVAGSQRIRVAGPDASGSTSSSSLSSYSSSSAGAAAAAAGPVVSNPCSGNYGAGGGYFPHPSDPTAFVVCASGGVPFVLWCPEGQVWNTGVLTCVANSQ